MFEEAIVKAPRSDVAELYVKYAKAEEQFGLSRHAVTVYERACAAVQDSDKLDMFRLCIRKVEQFCGITKTRPVYEKAVAELKMPRKVFIKEKIFESLRKLFGKDIEILVNY